MRTCLLESCSARSGWTISTTKPWLRCPSAVHLVTAGLTSKLSHLLKLCWTSLVSRSLVMGSWKEPVGLKISWMLMRWNPSLQLLTTCSRKIRSSADVTNSSPGMEVRLKRKRWVVFPLELDRSSVDSGRKPIVTFMGSFGCLNQCQFLVLCQTSCLHSLTGCDFYWPLTGHTGLKRLKSDNLSRLTQHDYLRGSKLTQRAYLVPCIHLHILFLLTTQQWNH